MKTLTLLVLAAGLMQAENHITALGVWPICESPAANAMLCSGFTPGHETYLLEIQSPDSDRTTVAYRYTVTGVNAAGKQVTVCKMIERARFDGGHVGIEINLGGIVSGLTFTVQGLGVVSQ